MAKSSQLESALKDLDDRAVDVLALLQADAAHGSVTHAQHTKVSALEIAVSDLRNALRNAG
jgi:hypothetical protein